MGRFVNLRKSIKYALIIGSLELLLLLVIILPWKWLSSFCAYLGKLAFYLIKEERLKTICNLTIAYGEKKNDAEIKKMKESNI